MSTIAHLVAEEVQWRVKCCNCGRDVRLYPADLERMFEPDEDERDARQRLKCTQCGVRGDNYLSASLGKSWRPGKDKGAGGAYEGIYGRVPKAEGERQD